MVNGPLPIFRMFVTSLQRKKKLVTEFKFCFAEFLIARPFFFSFSKEAMHLFAFHCYPLLHSNSLIYLKITTHCSKSTICVTFPVKPLELHGLTLSPSLSFNIEQPLEFKHLEHRAKS